MALPVVLLPVSGSPSAVYEWVPVLKSLGTRPIAWLTALVRLAQQRPRSILTYYHLVLVSALYHCATPIACLSQWAQWDCMVKNPLSFFSRLDTIFYLITSPHPFLLFSMHAIEWNAWLLARDEVMATLDFRLSGWTTLVVLLQD